MRASRPLYELSFPTPHTHYVSVLADLPSATGLHTDLAMAVWTPGSYLVREYAKHVEAIEARDPQGRPLEIAKIRKNRWRVATNGAPSFTLAYRVYCRQMSVQGNWVSSEFAMLNGAPTFIVPLHAAGDRVDVIVRPHESWRRVITSLPETSEHHFRATGWDQLVDSPIYSGNAPEHEFDAGGARHLLVNQGEESLWDGPKSAEATKAIVEATQSFWRTVPYDRYVFFNMIVDARGGLEHSNSTILMTTRYAMKKRKDYIEWLTLVSHEFFHTWNVKRLRPAALGPFDYENEVYTRDLWIAEGITNYYEAVLIRRAGLITIKEFLELVSEAIEQLQTTPGRLAQSLSQSSFDAWISLYRRDENSANTGISYYLKGSVAALLLDVEIRRRSSGVVSLDDVMRSAYGRFSGERGFESSEFRALASEIAGSDLSGWFEAVVDDTGELDYSPLLEWYGLELKPKNDTKKDKDEEKKAWLGVVTSEPEGRLVIDQVRRDTPAHSAGLNAEDEILAIDDYRVVAKDWKERLEHYRPGEEANILVARRGRLERVPVTFGEEPPKPWRVSVREDASEEQKQRLEAWIGKD
jgi:predicted metalloprotease with PDZ domain